jgi:hypothetical protein
MFKSSTPAAVPADVSPVAGPCAHPVPLAELERDLGGVPPEGWAVHLGKRGVVIVPDDLGRDSVSRGDARRILDERRADQLRKEALLKVQEQAAVEADRVRLAQIWKGVSADAIPVGVHPATAMLQAAADSRLRRLTPLEEALSNDSAMTYHSLLDEQEAS